MDSTTPFQPWAANDGDKNVKNEEELVDDAKVHRENVNHPKHTQTASHEKETVVASINTAGSSSGAERECSTPAKESKMDAAKIDSMQQFVMNVLSPEERQRVGQLLVAVEGLTGPERLLLYLRLPTGMPPHDPLKQPILVPEERQRVGQLLVAVEGLTGPERLLLYLRLPTGMPPHDPLKQPINPLGSRAELQQTVTWIQTHLEVDPDVSLPKQDVYDEYIAFCMSSNMKPLSTADFGKVMKQVYPSVRPRRLGTRGNSRYCYAGLRKKIKLEVPQLPDLGESSKDPNFAWRSAERTVCDWAENKLGVSFSNLGDLSCHLESLSVSRPARPSSGTPPLAAIPQTQGSGTDDTASRHLMKQLKRKIQTQSTPGRPKKNKGQDVPGQSPPSTSYIPVQTSIKHERDGEAGGEGEAATEGAAEVAYGYGAAYLGAYSPRAAYPPVYPPPPAPPDYLPARYPYPPPALPINLSSDVSLDLSTERRPPALPAPAPAPVPAPVSVPAPAPAPSPRLPLPGKKLILETYQSETRLRPPLASPSAATVAAADDDFPMTQYLPKKMRAAEILGGKLAAARLALAPAPAPPVPPSPSPSASPSGADLSLRSEVAFLEDPKNATSRSKSTAAALVREEREAASPARSGRAPTPEAGGCGGRRARVLRARAPRLCCGPDGVGVEGGVICEEKHSEILNRERVISICNMDKHALDDYLNEGSSQEHEEELLRYFQREPEGDTRGCADFAEPSLDPHDDHSQGKSEKLSQLRELLAKNLKNQSGSASQSGHVNQERQFSNEHGHGSHLQSAEGVFKPILGTDVCEGIDGQQTNHMLNNKSSLSMNGNKTNTLSYVTQNDMNCLASDPGPHLYNGNGHNVAQSPTMRAQQYDFVPISDGCHSPGNFHAKSPIGFGPRSHSPKIRKPIMMGGSLQTSPTSHSTAASPFVSPRNTPVPRSRLCPRPIPKHNGRRRRNVHPLVMGDNCSKLFVMPNDQNFISKSSMCGSGNKYCQPMSAPPSPNILNCTQLKNQIHHGMTAVPKGCTNLSLNFLPTTQFRDSVNGDHILPLSADPLSSEVSQFFQDSITFSPDTSFRSQSVPLKQGLCNVGLLSYNNTPVGSVPPTPVPNEFCDFNSLADTCDISRACLNPESLDKIYDAIDSSNDVLSGNTTANLIDPNENLRNGCDQLSDQHLLTDVQLNSLISTEDQLLDRGGQFEQSFSEENPADDNVEEFLKRTNSVEFDLSGLDTDKNKYYTSRSVPNTPLPYKRTVPNLQLEPRRSLESFVTNNFISSNGVSSKSVPSTPQLVEDRRFSYSNRDFLINGNSVSTCADTEAEAGGALDALLAPLGGSPATAAAADLLADLDSSVPYVDL